MKVVENEYSKSTVGTVLKKKKKKKERKKKARGWDWKRSLSLFSGKQKE